MQSQLAPEPTLSEADPTIIRGMEITDLERVTALEKEAFTQPWSANTLASELLENCFSYCSVIEQEGRVSGFAIYWRIAEEGHLIRIAIDAPLRGRGLGRQYLAWLIRDMKRNQVENIYLEVRQSNYPALRMYEHAGFQNVGVRKKYYVNGEDAVLMSLSLKEG